MIKIAPLELNFINDSPRVSGGNITADIQFSRPVQSLQCALTGLPYQDCKIPHTSMHAHTHEHITLVVNLGNGWTVKCEVFQF